MPRNDRAIAPQDGGRVRILLVGTDEAIVRLSRILERQGSFDVQHERSVIAALRKVADDHFHALVAQQEMGAFHGSDFLHVARLLEPEAARLLICPQPLVGTIDADPPFVEVCVTLNSSPQSVISAIRRAIGMPSNDRAPHLARRKEGDLI